LFLNWGTAKNSPKKSYIIIIEHPGIEEEIKTSTI
jgi:hypothetical protein